jgi:hypothetical protein
LQPDRHGLAISAIHHCSTMAASGAVTTFSIEVTAWSSHSLIASWHIVYNAIFSTHNGLTNETLGK